MVLLVKIQEAAIVENLKKRFFDDLIYVSYSMLLCSQRPVAMEWSTVECANRKIFVCPFMLDTDTGKILSMIWLAHNEKPLPKGLLLFHFSGCLR